MRILKLHKWDISFKQAVQIQRRLQSRIKLKPLSKKIRLIAAADVSFGDTQAIGAVCMFKYPALEPVEEIVKRLPLQFPYIPTLLTFREGPVLLECFKSLKINPDLILFDGQGIAHQRSMGLATHLGIILSKPAIGCAKSRLTGTFGNLSVKKGSYSYLKDCAGKIIGVALRTRDRVKPLFVSCGHLINLKDSIKIVLSCTRKYRIPEPLRYAHLLTKLGGKS